MASFNPTTAFEFQNALDQAKPGDEIFLPGKTLSGNFYITNSGEDGKLITISGAKEGNESTILTSTSGKTLDIGGDHIKVTNVKFENGNTAAHIQGNNNFLNSVVITNALNGIVLSGNQNSVSSCDIDCKETGILIKRGHGNDINSNILSSLTIAEGSWGGVLSFLIIKGPVDIKGSKYSITNVEAQGKFDIIGCGNELNNVALPAVNNIDSCNHLNAVTYNKP